MMDTIYAKQPNPRKRSRRFGRGRLFQYPAARSVKGDRLEFSIAHLPVLLRTMMKRRIASNTSAMPALLQTTGTLK